MNAALCEAFFLELSERGYSADGMAPGGTMHLDRSYVEAVEVAELLVPLVARREKVFRSVPVVGDESAKRTRAHCQPPSCTAR